MLLELGAGAARVDDALRNACDYLRSIQYPDGYWWAELQSNVSITSEAVLLHAIWDTGKTRPLHKAERYLRNHQREHGGWELFFGDGGELSVTIEAYMALRILGVAPADPALERAKKFILERGGITRSRVFTKMHLALCGAYEWRGLPAIPPWLMLLPGGGPFSIYDMSSWARGSTVPLMLVFDKKPVYGVPDRLNLDELYAEGRENASFEFPRTGRLLDDLFIDIDRIFQWAERHDLVPFRERGLRAAQRWVLERQEPTGDWGGIIPAMLNSLLALRALGYRANDPAVARGLAAVDAFTVETDEEYRVQPCVSPVWDTALVVRAMIEAGVSPRDPALARAGEWLVKKQILDTGDWAVKNRRGTPGGWAFEFDNRYYPDVDDSAVVVMALAALDLPDRAARDGSIARGAQWIDSMQCRPGGWGAFDVDNDADWLNRVPYADLHAMIDPNTADVTARVLEMHARAGTARDPASIERALAYLLRDQCPDGSWFGRWGVNYLYGTSGVLVALSLSNRRPAHDRAFRRGIRWLLGVQGADGGWGETPRSYDDPALKGKGASTPSQTAWALLGLIASYDVEGDAAKADDALNRAIERGVRWLLEHQLANGNWDEDEFTGTGFPQHFYLKYHLYATHFSLTALARYRAKVAGA